MSNTTQVILTATGPDRPGLVDEFTKAVFEAGGNLADSRMVNLRGQFAFMALIEADAERMNKLVEHASMHGRSVGLAVTVVPQQPPTEHAQGMIYRLKANALDQPGIAHRIGHLLHQHNINIEELETRLVPGPYSGRPQFNIALTMTVPPDVQLRKLREELSNLCDLLNCDFELNPA